MVVNNEHVYLLILVSEKKIALQNLNRRHKTQNDLSSTTQLINSHVR